jgi:hypothetical protein
MGEKMIKCDHEETTTTWVESQTDDWGYTEPDHWETKTKSLCKDIDLHRYQCTRCKMIGYYSSGARDYYEKGNDTMGLFK